MNRRTIPLIALVSSIAACATAPPRVSIARAAFADADSTSSTTIAPGVTHTSVHDSRGPWALHILEIDARRCDPVLQARAPGTVLSARATTSGLSAGALAGINADFFMIPGGTPVGAQVTRGEPIAGPAARPVFGVTNDGWRIGTAHIDGHARVNGDSIAISQINRPAVSSRRYPGARNGVTLFTPWIGDSVPADSTARFVTLRVLDADAGNGRGVVTASDSSAAATPIRAGTAILIAHRSARAWARRRAPGDTVSWSVRVIIDTQASLDAPANVDAPANADAPASRAAGAPGERSAAPATEVVGGFPVLLRDGVSVLAGQTIAPSFGPQRHPRTAVGWTPDERLLFVVVDGRQAPYSDGMSLAELAWVFLALGASDAINLDGGGSSAMVVNGAVVSRPSDRQGERAVGNALVLAGCGDPVR